MTDEEEIRLEQECNRVLKRIQKVRLDYLMDLGIEPDLFSGGFAWYNEKKVLEIVEEHPHLHIVSVIGEIDYNRYIPESEFYYLAKGDRDPTLEVYLPPPSANAWKRTLDSFVEKVGSKPEDPGDEFVVKLLMRLANGADAKDPSVVKNLK